MKFNWVQIGSALMFLGVALGAFGAHMLRGRVSEYAMDVYKTGVLYHLVHALALFAVAWLVAQGVAKVNLAGMCFAAGIVLFSGSLYALAITGVKALGAITPLGGLAFLAGWAVLFFCRV